MQGFCENELELIHVKSFKFIFAQNIGFFFSKSIQGKMGLNIFQFINQFPYEYYQDLY